MRITRLKEFIRQFDFFSHTQYFRYKLDDSYKTVTSGLASIILLIIFTIVFTNLVANTIGKNLISGRLELQIENDPSLFDTSTNIQNRFMFAVGVTGVNLNDHQNKFFNVVMENRTYIKNGNSTIQIRNNIPLIPCRRDQWKGINTVIDTVYDDLDFSQWLCPPTNYLFQFQGKFTSEIFKFAKISIQACIPSSNISCATSTAVDQLITSLQGLQANFYFVNPLINPSSQTYLDYYLEDRNYFTFSKITGASANVYFSKYEIDTDLSLFPWSEIQSDVGAISNEFAQFQTFAVTNPEYAKIYLRKSVANLLYERSFFKIDQAFAYIGGLLATVLSFLFLFKNYNKCSYEIQIGDQIFKENSVRSFGSAKFNFIVFLGYSFYTWMVNLGISIKWKAMQRYHRCRKESIKQLDIYILFRKIQFFQHSLSIILDDHHLKGLYLLNKPSITQIRRNRKKYLLNQQNNEKLDRKANQIFVEDFQYEIRQKKTLELQNSINKILNDQINKENEKLQKEVDENNIESDRNLISQHKINKKSNIRKDILNLNILRKEMEKGDVYSNKIYQKLHSQKEIQGLEVVNNRIMLIADQFDRKTRDKKEIKSHQKEENIEISPSKNMLPVNQKAIKKQFLLKNLFFIP